jgi:hypothetical protein
MDSVKKLEKTIGDLFKGAPALSEGNKEGLVKAWPWIALIFGILQLLAAWGLWRLTRVTNALNDISTYYLGSQYGLTTGDKMIIYLGLAMLVIDGVILLMAYPELKKRARRGWDLLFIGALLNAVYSVVTLFIDARGVGSFIFSLIGSAIGFYLLFQVREKYKGASTPKSATKA